MIDSRQKLSEAIEDEQKGLKVCRKHPENVVYDEKFCPACRIQHENTMSMRKKELTSDDNDA